MGVGSKWLLPLATAFLALDAVAAYYYVDDRGYYNVFQCGPQHTSVFGYRGGQSEECCRRKGTPPDRNSCFNGTECFSWPLSICYRPVTTTAQPTTPTSTSTTSTSTASTSTTPSTTTTAPTTTTTRTTTTTTTATTAPTTTTPTTTTPTTTTPTTTTPTPTTSTTTGEVLFSLCADELSSFRILNGRPVQNECAYKGIANITIPSCDTCEWVSRCHAVYTTVLLDKKMEDVFVTTDICAELLTMAQQQNVKIALGIGNRNYPPTSYLFQFLDGPNGLRYLKIHPVFKSLTYDFGNCQSKVCAYNTGNPFMPLLEELRDCRVVSAGVVDPYTFAQNGLNEALIEFADGQCEDLTAGEVCMVAKSGLRTVCLSDYSAPVYCTAPINNERLLVGVIANEHCDTLTPAFKVILIHPPTPKKKAGE